MRHSTTMLTGNIVWTNVRLIVFSTDDTFRFLVRSTFRKLGAVDVLSTSVAADAQPLLAQSPHLGLVDLDGDAAEALAFLQRVRSVSAAMPVLVALRSEDKAMAHHALHLGIEGVVPKPISGHELSVRASETLRAPRRLPPPAKPKAAVHWQFETRTTPAVEAPPAAVPPRPPVPAPAAPPPRAREVPASQAVAAPPPRARPAPAAPGVAAPAQGRVAAEEAPVPVRISSGRFEEDDIAASPPAPVASDGGTLSDDDVVSSPKVTGGKLDFDGFEGAVPAPKISGGKLVEEEDEEAKRKKRAAAASAWKEAMEAAGYKPRKGKDVATLNVDAVVAEHGAWLASQGAEGQRANFQKMDLGGVDLGSAELANAGFRDADLSDATLFEARLDGADFRYAVLGAANLCGANLGVAHLRHADLQLAQLEGASLRGADLSGAKLRGARLAGADFKGATLVGTDLRDADLSKAEGVTTAQVAKALCDGTTRLPPGVSKPRPVEGR